MADCSSRLDDPQPGPALIFTHGGPMRQMMLGFHYMYYYHNAYAMNQYLASQGYVVLSVNYRLGIMYGRAFREAPNASWRGAAEYKDVVAGARYLQGLADGGPEEDRSLGRVVWRIPDSHGSGPQLRYFCGRSGMHGVHDWSVFLPRWENRPGAPDAKEAEKLAFDSSPNAAVSVGSPRCC